MYCCWLAVRAMQRDALWVSRDSGTRGLAGSLEKIAFGMHRHASASLHSTISLAFIKEEKVALRADGECKGIHNQL